MNFIIGIPKLEWKNGILVAVDRLTKYAHFSALWSPFKASIITPPSMETFQKLHANPKIIVSDREPNLFFQQKQLTL